MTRSAQISAQIPAHLPAHLPARLDRLFTGLCLAAALLVGLTLLGLLVALLIGGWPALSQFGWRFFVSATWDPVRGQFGAAGPLVGTLVTAALALTLALPLALGVAVFLVEYCPRKLAGLLGTGVELLAGIPSIVYGMWGLFVLAPWFAENVQVPLLVGLDQDSFLGRVLYGIPNGANIFTASLVLAVMVLPYMASVFRELLLAVPAAVREAAYGMGCTSYEVVAHIMLPYIRRSATGAVMLGQIGRAHV